MNKDTYKEDLKSLIELDDDIKKQYDYLVKQNKDYLLMNLFEERLYREELKEKLIKKNKIILGLQKEISEFNSFFKKQKKQMKGINLRRAKLGSM